MSVKQLMSPKLFRLLLLRPGMYEPIQAWCRKVWCGAAWGGDLAHAIIRENADEFLDLATDAGWIVRGATRRVPGFGDCGGNALPTRNGIRVIATPEHRPFSSSEYMYEPHREHSAYAELVAVTVLSREYFEWLTERWRAYAERAETAELRMQHAEHLAGVAAHDTAQATKRKLTTQRRAHAIRRHTLSFRKTVQWAWLNAIAAAVPHVADPTVSAQLVASLELALDKLRWLPADEPVWPQDWAAQWREERGL